MMNAFHFIFAGALLFMNPSHAAMTSRSEPSETSKTVTKKELSEEEYGALLGVARLCRTIPYEKVTRRFSDRILYSFPTGVAESKEVLECCLKLRPRLTLQHGPESLQSDFRVVSDAVRVDPTAFEFSAPNLRGVEDRSLTSAQRDERITLMASVLSQLPSKSFLLSPTSGFEVFGERKSDYIKYFFDCMHSPTMASFLFGKQPQIASVIWLGSLHRSLDFWIPESYFLAVDLSRFFMEFHEKFIRRILRQCTSKQLEVFAGKVIWIHPDKRENFECDDISILEYHNGSIFKNEKVLESIRNDGTLPRPPGRSDFVEVASKVFGLTKEDIIHMVSERGHYGTNGIGIDFDGPEGDRGKFQCCCSIDEVDELSTGTAKGDTDYRFCRVCQKAAERNSFDLGIYSNDDSSDELSEEPYSLYEELDVSESSLNGSSDSGGDDGA